MRHLLKLITIISLIFLSSQAHAERKLILEPEMEQAMEKLKALRKEDRCDEYWDVFWPLAKKGNLNAVFQLYMIIMPVMHKDTIFPPGTHDALELERHLVILKIHSLRSQIRKQADSEPDSDMTLESYENTLFNNFTINKFNYCLQRSTRDECIKDAIKERDIPSFDEYVVEIESSIAQGKKSICYVSGYDDDHTKPETETFRRFH